MIDTPTSKKYKRLKLSKRGKKILKILAEFNNKIVLIKDKNNETYNRGILDYSQKNNKYLSVIYEERYGCIRKTIKKNLFIKDLEDLLVEEL